MKKLFLSLLLCCIAYFSYGQQQPVVVSQPQKFMRYIYFQDSVILKNLLQGSNVGHLAVSATGKIILDTTGYLNLPYVPLSLAGATRIISNGHGLRIDSIKAINGTHKMALSDLSLNFTATGYGMGLSPNHLKFYDGVDTTNNYFDLKVFGHDTARIRGLPTTFYNGLTSNKTPVNQFDVLRLKDITLTAGYVPFSNGTTVVGDANLFWDNTNKRLGIGGTPGAFTLDVNGTTRLQGTTTIGSLTGVLKGTSGVISVATSGTDYEVPLTFNSGLTRSGNTIKLNGLLLATTYIQNNNFKFSLDSGNVLNAPTQLTQIARLADLELPNAVISGLITTASGTTATTASGTWRINNLNYTKGTTTNTTIPAQDATLSQYVLIYGTTSGTILGLNGTLSADPVVPSLPANTTDIAEVLITPTSVTVGGGGRGTVTSISGVVANGFTWSIANPTSTPAITLRLQNATTTLDGQLSHTDWNTFNGKAPAFSVTAPITYSANVIALPASTNSVNGYLTSADHTTFNAKQQAITIGAFSGSGQTNGATLSAGTLTFGPATATIPGMVSTGTQTFAGAKTFTGAVTYNSTVTYAGDITINGVTAGRGGGSLISNTTFGNSAISLTATGTFNSAFGNGALSVLSSGGDNTALGASALSVNTSGSNNTAIGSGTLIGNTSHNNNTAVGKSTLANVTGADNVGLGYNAGASAGTGNQNTLIGSGAGQTIGNASGDVMIGYQAGANETNSNKLYIANSNTATPLIGGDFSAGTLNFNGYVTLLASTTSLASLNIPSGTAPTSPTNGDVWQATNHLYGRLNGVTYQLDQQSGTGISALTGDVTASGTGSVAATLATVNSNVGSFGDASHSLSVTANGKGLITAVSTNSIQIAESQVTSLVSDLAAKQATGNYITALTGDATASGPGSAAITLATVNSNVGTFNNVTVNGKGLVTAASNVNYWNALVPTAVKTSNYTAAVNDFVPCDNTSGTFTVTLPTAPADKSLIGIKMVVQSGTNTITMATGGSDVFNVAGGSTTGTLTLLKQGILLQYKASSAIWYVLSDDLPLSQLDARYAATGGGTLTYTHTNGYAITGSPFNNTGNQTWAIDTTKVSSILGVTDTIAAHVATIAWGLKYNSGANSLAADSAASTGVVSKSYLGNFAYTKNQVQTSSFTLTNKTISGSSNTISNIANASLTNSTISGIALGSNLADLTAGRGIILPNYNGGTTQAIILDTTKNYTWGKIQTFIKGITTSGNFSAAAWGLTGVNLYTQAATYTDNSSSGTVTNNAVNVIGQPTLVASSTTTYTNAFTLYITGPPVASTNVTISNAVSLQVNSGTAAFIGGFGSANSGVFSNAFFVGGVASSTSSQAQLQFGGGSATNYRASFYGSTSTTVTSGNTYGTVIVAQSPFTTANSSTTPFAANLVVQKLGTITLGSSATLTTSTSLYVNGQNSVGTNKYSAIIYDDAGTGTNNLWAKYGITRVSGFQADSLSTFGTTSNIAAGSTAGSIINIPAVTLTDNVTASGTVTNFAAIGTAQTTLAATNSSITYTNGFGAYFTAPTSGTNVTMTNKYALGLAFDATHLATFAVNSAGLLTLNATSTITITPATLFSGDITYSGKIGSTATNLFVGSNQGTTNISTAKFLFGGASSIDIRNALGGNSSSTITSGASYVNTVIGSSIISTANSSTTAWAANLVVNPLGAITLGGGGATLTKSTTLFVGAAIATGGTNYTGYFDTGQVNIVSGLTVGGTLNAINSSATATAAQVAGGTITSTSAAPTTITMPTATLLATQLGAVQGTKFTFTVDNSAGASTVTVALGTGMTSGLTAGLTIVAGKAFTYTIYFTSTTACVMSQIL